MSSRGLWLKIAGLPVGSVGGVGDLEFSTIIDGGCEEASWSMSLPPTFGHPLFRAGRVVQIKNGPSNAWSGVLSAPEYSEDGWSFTAAGHGPNAGDWLCFDSGGNTTSVPDTAIDRAIADGLPCTRPVSISAVPFSGTATTDEINTLGALLDDQSTSVSKHWGVNPNAEFYQAADPTTPRWALVTDNAQVSRVDEEYASDVFVRYRSGPTTYATAHGTDPTATLDNRREYPFDATSLGVITAAKAQSIADGVIAEGKARYQLTEPFVVTGGQLTTIGGTVAHLPMVRAQHMVKALNVRNEQGTSLPFYNFVIGRTQYRAVEDEMTISPVALAARTLGDVFARMLAAAAAR